MIALLFSAFLAVQPQDYELGGDFRVKRFLVSDEPDLISNDYRNFSGNPDYEMRLRNRIVFSDNWDLELNPYAWYSREHQLSRLGLFSEFKYILRNSNPKEEIPLAHLGYGHHSLHNADRESPDHDGWYQDWFLMNMYFYHEAKMAIGTEFRFYFHNTVPMEIKDRYDSGDPSAITQLGLRVSTESSNCFFSFLPYFQIGKQASLYGFRGEVTRPINRNFYNFLDIHYYKSGNEDRWMIGLGVAVKFN
ncbi:MAG: hypothetical protein AAB646_00325 [Patescibacteria group bacterium]